jgi:hypothetical protein
MATKAYVKQVDEHIRIERASSLHGEVAEGYQVAYDAESEMAGVVIDNTFYPTLPLNGHRGRDLAEGVFGNRSVDEWRLNRSVVVEAELIKKLPAFDSYNQRYADSFTGAVLVSVVYHIPGYGAHIRITQA